MFIFITEKERNQKPRKSEFSLVNFYEKQEVKAV